MTEAATPATGGTEITLSLDAVRGEVSKLDQIAAGLAELEREHPRDVVFDMTSAAGMESAIVARRAWREPRIAVEKARKAAKAPVLDLGRTIDKVAEVLEVRFRAGEDHYDDQIKAEEGRKEAIKQQRLQEEAERIAGIRRQIVAKFRPPEPLPDGQRRPSAALRAIFATVEAEPVTAERFGDLVIEAQEAKVQTLAWLTAAIDDQELREAEQAELARQREELAEQRRKDAAEAEERRRAEAQQAREEAEERARVRAAEDAERDRRADELRQEQARIDAQRAELDRREAEAREAERVRQAAEQRAEAEARQAAEVARAAEVAARQRVSVAGPAMLELLRDWKALDDENGQGPTIEHYLGELRTRRDALVFNLQDYQP